MRSYHLQAGFTGIDEAEDRICAAKHNAALWSWHCTDSCDGIFAIHRLIRADLLAYGQAGKHIFRYSKFVSISSNFNSNKSIRLPVYWSHRCTVPSQLTTSCEASSCPT